MHCLTSKKNLHQYLSEIIYNNTSFSYKYMQSIHKYETSKCIHVFNIFNMYETTHNAHTYTWITLIALICSVGSFNYNVEMTLKKKWRSLLEPSKFKCKPPSCFANKKRWNDPNALTALKDLIKRKFSSFDKWFANWAFILRMIPSVTLWSTGRGRIRGHGSAHWGRGPGTWWPGAHWFPGSIHSHGASRQRGLVCPCGGEHNWKREVEIKRWRSGKKKQEHCL